MSKKDYESIEREIQEKEDLIIDLKQEIEALQSLLK
jgi:hypothetical protein